MRQTYIVGDIHGCVKTLTCLVEDKFQLTHEDELYLLGDYIDRGPDSKGVIDYLLYLKKEKYKVFPIRGNHEDMMLQSTKFLQELELWMGQGAEQTLKSFGAKSADDILSDYSDFFLNLPLFIELKDRGLILVHAGINLFHPDPFKDKETILWTRNSLFSETIIENRIIIHGHTPKTAEDIKLSLLSQPLQIINLDGGCVYSRKTGRGNLIGLNVEKMELWIVPNMDM